MASPSVKERVLPGCGVDWQATPSGDDDGGLESLAREADDPKAAAIALLDQAEQETAAAMKAMLALSASSASRLMASHSLVALDRSAVLVLVIDCEKV